MNRYWWGGLCLGVLAPSAFALGAQVATAYSFRSGAGGEYHPSAGLVKGADGSLYGTTSQGGALPGGTVFKITTQGQESVVYAFGATPNGGSTPLAGLIQLADGYFYGTTWSGGGGTSHPQSGVVFKVSATGIYSKLHVFGNQSDDGLDPASELVLGGDGYLYGVTPSGGPYNHGGTLFKISTSGVFTNLHNFGSRVGEARGPVSGLVLHPDGNLYGTTLGGGTYASGTVYKVSPAGQVSVVYEFGLCNEDGLYPDTTPIVGADGALYGTTSIGGVVGLGTVYRVTTDGRETVLYSFGSVDHDGAIPRGSPIFLADGTLLGTTSQGGVYRDFDIYGTEGGTIYSLSPSGVYTQLHSFGGAGDPEWLWGGLTNGGDGSYYGTGFFGGATNEGGIYKVTLSEGAGSASSIQTAPFECKAPKSHRSGGALPLSALLVGLLLAMLRGVRKA